MSLVLSRRLTSTWRARCSTRAGSTTPSRAIEQGLSCDPKALDALLGLTNALSRAGRITRAIETVARACALHPDSVAALTRHADLLVRAARFDEAELPLARIEVMQQSDLLAGSQRLLCLNHLPAWTPRRIYDAMAIDAFA